MRYCSYLALSCVMFVLIGCTSYQTYVNDLLERRACREVCIERLHACNKVCYDNCPFCCANSKFNTKVHYNRYKQQERIQGNEIIRQLNSYRDPLQCRKTSCDCLVDHKICLRACSLKTPEYLQVSPNCSL